MTTATEHSLALLTNWKARQGPTGEALIVTLMLEDSYFSSIEERVEKILKMLDGSYPHYSEIQKSLAIEALSVLNFKHAERIHTYLLERKSEIDKSVFFTGVIGAHVWADESGTVNRGYQKRFPTLLGEVLTQYARHTLSENIHNHIDLGRWEELLKAYLSAKHVSVNKSAESARRCRLVCEALNHLDMTNLDGFARSVIASVARAALETLSLNAQIELLADTAKVRQNTKRRLGLYAVISCSGADINNLMQHAYYWMDAKRHLVFASEKDATCFADFYREVSLEKPEFRRKDTLRIDKRTSMPIPKNSSGEECEVVTEFSAEDSAILCAKLDEFYEKMNTPAPERLLPALGTLFGSITFEWVPPSKK
jgi:hypothetical protein